jgi:hypothetical protein
MSTDRENLVLTYLRHIDTEVSGLLTEVKQRIGLLEAQYASISRRVDRIGCDVERIRGAARYRRCAGEPNPRLKGRRDERPDLQEVRGIMLKHR